MEQGIFLTEQGIVCPEQGIHGAVLIQSKLESKTTGIAGRRSVQYVPCAQPLFDEKAGSPAQSVRLFAH